MHGDQSTLLTGPSACLALAPAVMAAWKESRPGEAVLGEPRHQLTELENWHFETRGWLLVPGAAAGQDDAELDAAGLERHEVLVAYVEDLCGIGFRLDLPLGPIPSGLLGGDSRTRDPAREFFHEAEGYILKDDRDGVTDPARGYDVRARVRQCQGLIAVWALEDIAPDQGFAVVSGSHLGDVEPPAALAAGRDLRSDGLSVVSRPAMRAGDLLLVAAATMHGLLAGTRPQQCCQQMMCSFISRTAPPSVGSLAAAAARGQVPDEAAPSWMAQLSPTARAMLAPALEPGSRTNQVVMSDGAKVWLAEPIDIAESHPGLLTARDEASLARSGISAEEVYFFDLNGYLVVPRVMDAAWLAQARDAIAPQLQASSPAAADGSASAVQQQLMKEHPAMAGWRRPSFSGGNLFELPDGRCDAFRRCIDHPQVVARLNWMMGGGSVTASSGSLLLMSRGSVGQVVHSGATNPTAAGHSYAFRNGRVMAGASLNVAWQLADSPAGSGGFVVCPGSHKAKFPVPQAVRWADDRTTLPEVPMKAGDVLFFLGSAVAHGAVRWQRDEWRCVMLLQYQAKHAAWSGRLWAPRL
jgi:ectoine hydroxylase-related dioxygenase (phytanoyl-CoA dioxygenase family)